HDTYENQRHLGMAKKRSCPENQIRIRPYIAKEALRTIADQKRPKRKRIRQQEKPHHDLSVAQIKWRMAASPFHGFGSRRGCGRCSSLCHRGNKFFEYGAKTGAS